MPAPPTDLGHIKGAVYIPQCVAIRLFWTLPNKKTAINVLHGSYASAPTFTQAQVNALFTVATTALTSTGLANRLDTDTTLTRLGIRDMRQGSEGFGYGEWLSNNAGVSGSGTGAAAPLPPQIAFVVTLKTAFSGQANRGRVYLPGWSSAADDGNGAALDAAGVDAVEFVQALQTGWGGAGFPLVIAHPARQEYTGHTGVVHPGRPAGTVLVTGVVKLNNVWDTQRLRSHV